MGQCVFDMLGMVPGAGLVIDASNGLIYLVRGRFGDAGWSAVAFIPGIGTLGPVAKYVDRFLEVVRKLPSGAANDLIRRVSNNSFWKKHIAPRINPARGLDNGDDIVRHDIDRGFPRELYVRLPGRQFTETLAGGHLVTHTMDELGRIVSSEWIVRNVPEHLRHSRYTGGLKELMANSGKAGDDYAHRVAHSTGGPMSTSNFRPQHGNANRKAQKGAEEALVRLVDEGHHVRMRVEDIFDEGNKTLRPDSFVIRWWVDGQPQKAWRFPNDSSAGFTKNPAEIQNQLARLLGYQIPDTLAGLAAMGLPPTTEQPEDVPDPYAGPVQNLRVTDRSESSVTFEWDPPATGTGPFTYYLEGVQDPNWSSTGVKVTGLSCGRELTLGVSAVSSAGTGPQRSHTGRTEDCPHSYQQTDWTPNCTDRTGEYNCYWDRWADGDDGRYYHTMAISEDRPLDTTFEWRFDSVPQRDNFEIWVRIPPQDEITNPPYATVTYYVRDSRDKEWRFAVDQRAISGSGGGWIVAARNWTLQGTVVINVYDNRGNSPTYFTLHEDQKYLARYAADAIRLYSPG